MFTFIAGVVGVAAFIYLVRMLSSEGLSAKNSFRTMIAVCVMVAAIIAVAGAAKAQNAPNGLFPGQLILGCAEAGAFQDHLASLGLKPVAGGVDSDGDQWVVMADQQGTYHIMLLTKNGEVMCGVATGTGWRSIQARG